LTIFLTANNTFFFYFFLLQQETQPAAGQKKKLLDVALCVCVCVCVSLSLSLSMCKFLEFSLLFTHFFTGLLIITTAQQMGQPLLSKAKET
jgi:small neutral amino acid transporter SnatA (MarC family)